MEQQNPCWECDEFSVTEGFLSVSQNSKVRYDAHKRSLLVPIVRQIEHIWRHVVMFTPVCIVYCRHVVWHGGASLVYEMLGQSDTNWLKFSFASCTAGTFNSLEIWCLGVYIFLSFKIALIVLLALHCPLRFTSYALITLLFATIRFTRLLIPSMCMHIQTLIFCWERRYFDFAQGWLPVPVAARSEA